MCTTTLTEQPRAIGAAMVSSKLRDGRSCIDGLRQSGALKILFPRMQQHLEAVLINTAGGITGGDDFAVEASAGDATELSITTQAAERAYRAQPGQTGQLCTTLTVANAARLNWLPQETILFDGCALRRRLNVDVGENARFLMVEPILFGRRAMGEDLRNITFDDQITIKRSGHLLYRDGLNFRGDVAHQLDRPAVAGGARAMASLVFVAPEAEGHLDPLRDLLTGASGGVSLLQPDMLVMRLLAGDGYSLRKSLVPVLDRLTQNQLPKSWRL